MEILNSTKYFLQTVFIRAFRLHYAPIYIFLLALILGLLFSFIIYPAISNSFHIVLDADGYGKLGMGLYNNSSLSYFPDTQPTVNRGPVYPFFLYICLIISRGWFPYSIQIIQSALFGITCVLIYWISKKLWNKKVAILSSFFCAIHPFLIWFTARIWIETLATFLFTSIIATTLWFWSKQSFAKAVLLGIVIGLSVLCKQTFLPFVILIPILFLIFMGKRVKLLYLMTTILVAAAVITPWTIRNMRLTKNFIPVHLLAGFNMQMGDGFAENYLKSPLSYDELWNMKKGSIDSILTVIPKNIPRWKWDVAVDSILVKYSIRRYLDDPIFLLKKIISNAIMFWTLGNTRLKSILIIIINIPILLLFIISSLNIFKHKLRSIFSLHIVIIICYFLFHLPIFAFARLSVVLVPTMIAYGISFIEGKMEREKKEITAK